jgi:HK97 family phage major capsid protein
MQQEIGGLTMSMTNYADITAQPEYDIQFWNSMRGKLGKVDMLTRGCIMETGTYELPAGTANKLMKALEKESIFRNIATVLKAYKSGYRILTKDCKDLAEFVPENGEIPAYDGMEDFNEKSVGSHKLAVFVKFDENFVHDAVFNIEQYLIGRLARNFGRAEDNSFINGTGKEEPTGILHDTDGAEVALVAEHLSYDDVITLYFSVDKEYRHDGVWMMNDKTALALRKLKDADGNYLWSSNSDTILGKQVVISEYMPDIAEGTKPVAFGDFSYYWVIGRKPVSVRTLTEKFALLSQIGYLAYEFLDGKLIRKDAIKVIQMKSATD